jgi:hypothetical protein
MKGGVGALPPARGGTPVPRPKPSDYRYIRDLGGRTGDRRNGIAEMGSLKNLLAKGQEWPHSSAARG